MPNGNPKGVEAGAFVISKRVIPADTGSAYLPNGLLRSDYKPQNVACPRCGASKGEPCHTLTTRAQQWKRGRPRLGKSTSTFHVLRHTVWSAWIRGKAEALGVRP